MERVSNLNTYSCYLLYPLLPVTSLFHQYKNSTITLTMVRLPWFNNGTTILYHG